MGTLHYANGTYSISIPDHVLAHLQIVATTKLRRNESFTVTCTQPDESGKATLWMQPAIPLLFEFDSPDQKIDPEYLRSLAEAAATNSGVVLDWGPTQATPSIRPVAA